MAALNFSLDIIRSAVPGYDSKTNLFAKVDLLARVYKNVFFAGKLVYEDDIKAINDLSYGLRVGDSNFNLGFDYNHIGDKHSIDGRLYHKASESTEVATGVELDLDTSKIALQTALKYKLDDRVTIASRVDHFGLWDLAFTAKLSDQLTTTFTTGGTSKGIFDGKTGEESYSGLSFKLSL